MACWCRGVLLVQLNSTISSIFSSHINNDVTSAKYANTTLLGILYTSSVEVFPKGISTPYRSVALVFSVYKIGKFSFLNLFPVFCIVDGFLSTGIESFILNPAIKSSSAASSSLLFCNVHKKKIGLWCIVIFCRSQLWRKLLIGCQIKNTQKQSSINTMVRSSLLWFVINLLVSRLKVCSNWGWDSRGIQQNLPWKQLTQWKSDNQTIRRI